MNTQLIHAKGDTRGYRVVDHVPYECLQFICRFSKSIIMDTGVAIGIGLAIGGVLMWGLQRYQAIMADGKVTLEEVVDAVKDGTDVVADAAETIDEVRDMDAGED